MWTIFHTEASLGWGGQEIRVLNECLGMKSRGHRPVIISEEDSGIFQKARQAGIETIPVSFSRKDYPASLVMLVKAIRNFRPDVVNTHSSRDSWLASAAAMLVRPRPLIIRTRHISTPVSTGLASSIIYRHAPDCIVTTSEAIRERLININRVEPGRAVSIPTGIDMGAFDPELGYPDLRAELGVPASAPLIGMVSVLRSWKGHDCFIDAAALVKKTHPEACFIIAGSGPREEYISKKIASSGLEKTVLMLGHRNDVPMVLSSLDVFVQPSYANEGVPQSIVQAMAMKVPVAASGLPSFLEIVEDRNTGLLFKANDARGLAESISMLLEDRLLASRLSVNARRLVIEGFSIEKMLDRTEALYEGLILSKKGRTAGRSLFWKVQTR
ncbi:MAG: glycosyltransferase family 4 protein [Candidatus Methylomirabilis sp.]|nr:glycosyltransferase family 4 protein [Deltaproteobacteria bacterium]